MVISMLVTALYNVVDTYFVSGLGTTPTAAVSVAFPLAIVFSGIGLTFGAGSGSFISRLLGAKETEKPHQVATIAVYTCIIISTIVSVFMILFLKSILQIIGATDIDFYDFRFSFKYYLRSHLYLCIWFGCCRSRNCNLNFAGCFFPNLCILFP